MYLFFVTADYDNVLVGYVLTDFVDIVLDSYTIKVDCHPIRNRNILSVKFCSQTHEIKTP